MKADWQRQEHGDHTHMQRQAGKDGKPKEIQGEKYGGKETPCKSKLKFFTLIKKYDN